MSSSKKKRLKTRSIYFPDELWDAIGKDAERCKRTPLKQMEAILLTYYELGDIELDYERFQKMKSKQTRLDAPTES